MSTRSSVFSHFEFFAASTLPGVAAVVAAAALVAYSNLSIRLFVNSEEQERGSSFCASRRRIMQCLPMYSCVLVTAVISSAVWFHLPANIFGDISGRAALRNYGHEMTLFLGVTYTLTTLVAVAWPIWRLYRRAHEVGYAPKPEPSIQWTNEDILSSAGKVLAVLAPLITSFLYTLLEGQS